MSEAVLRARGVSKRLGRRAVLDRLDFELLPGEIAVLVGANGTGKTTLLRVLAGLSLPSEGQLEISGATERRRARAAVGYVGHETMLYGALSAAENLRFAARLYGRGGDRVDDLLEAVGLRGVADQRVGSFSRGMRQRLALARAQVHEPSILLLDEPFNALDPSSTEAFASSMRGLRNAGTALCFVSHDLELAAHLADVAWLLRSGRCERVAGATLELHALHNAMAATP